MPNGADVDILEFQMNADSKDFVNIRNDGVGDMFVTVDETGQNTGVFESTDSNHISHLKITSNEDDMDVRSFDFTVDYNDTTINALVNYFAGSIDMLASSINGTWSSGEPITVELTDEDFNTNTRTDNDFSVKNSATIPAIQIGNPFTLGHATAAYLGNDSVNPIITNDDVQAAEAEIDRLETSRATSEKGGQVAALENDLTTLNRDLNGLDTSDPANVVTRVNLEAAIRELERTN